jgi:hypothetical protein
LQLRQKVSHVALHRLFREEEAVADLTVDEAFRNELEDFDLPGGRLLLELPEGSGERDYLGVALAPSGGHCVKPTRVIDITGQDLFALCSIHDIPRIGAPCFLL